MKTRRRKLTKGGEAISGQQGCVIIPSLLVDAQMRTRNANYVTKIFYKADDFEEEKDNNDMILSTIDPRGTFTSARYTVEPVDSRYLTPTEIASCPDLRGRDTRTLRYLNYKFLGKSIDEIVQKDVRINAETSKNIIAALSNLSVKVLYMNNELRKFHNDMHEGNIMYNFKDEHAYLIDFAKLSSQHNSDGPLTDMQGIIITTRLFASMVVGQRRLPKPLIDQLNSFIADTSVVLRRASSLSTSAPAPAPAGQPNTATLTASSSALSNAIASALSPTPTPEGEDPAKQSRTFLSKFLTDFSLAYSTSVGGRRRKTLRRPRH